MRRRTVLALLATAPAAGCLDGILGAGTDGSNEAAAAYDGLWIAAVYPEEIDREFVDYEYVRIENAGPDPVDPTGVEVRYGGGVTYTFDGPTLEPGAIVLLVSRTVEETVFAMSPPAYLQSAGFGDDPKTSVLDGSGTVRLVSPGGTTIDEREYSTNSRP